MQLEERSVAFVGVEDVVKLLALAMETGDLQRRHTLASSTRAQEHSVFNRIFVVAELHDQVVASAPGGRLLMPHASHMRSAASSTGRSASSSLPALTPKRVHSDSTKA